MIPVPQSVLDSLARSFATTTTELNHFSGGREESDGILFAYPYEDTQRLLKVLAVPAADRRRGLLCLEERLQFAHFLGQNGAQITYPQPSPHDNLYETFLGESHLWIGYSMDVAPGETKHPRQWNSEFFRDWGQTIGMLHRLAGLYPSWQTSIDPVSGEEFLTWSEEWQSFHDWIQDDEVKRKWVEIGERLHALPITREVFGFIHNDPHSWNLLVDGNRITLLDFDVANHHWFVNDIAIACQSVLFSRSGGLDRPVYNRERLHTFLDSFLEGYCREYHLSPEWFDRLDIFVAYRRILLFTVMYEGIRSKPNTYASWKKTILDQPDVIGAFSARPGLG